MTTAATLRAAMKPGYRTTEFYIALATEVGVVAAAGAGWLPPKYAAFATSVSAAAYAISRGLAKVFPPKPGP